MKLQKLTKSASDRGRSYDDACATAHALDLIGDRWALPVMRELMLGARRFGDLRASLPGISANVLTQRLEGLEAAGIICKRKLPPPASVQVYELTEWGLEGESILLALGRWGVRSPWHNPTLPLSAVGLMLSFRAKFDPVKAEGRELAIGFRFGEEPFFVEVGGGVMRAERGEGRNLDATVTGTPSAVAGLVYGKVSLKTLEQQGALAVTGDRTAVKTFANMWEMPPKAG